MKSIDRSLAKVALLFCVAFIVPNAWSAVSGKSQLPLVTRVMRGAQSNRSKLAAQSTSRSTNRISNDYIIGPSDVLNINVWKDPELTRTVIVRPDGRITMPLVGELQVSGLTAMNVQLLLSKKLKDYVANPEVTVIVQEVKSQTYVVVGKVVKPGSFEIGKPTTVLEAIAISGGFLDFAKTNKCYVLRRQPDGSQIRLPFDYKKVINQKNVDQNVELRNGDTVVVP